MSTDPNTSELTLALNVTITSGYLASFTPGALGLRWDNLENATTLFNMTGVLLYQVGRREGV